MKNTQLVITSFSNDIDAATQIVQNEIARLEPNQVLVRNKFIGINALYDRELYKGAVPYIKVDFPYVFGVEAVGEIVEIGTQVKNANIGDAVATVKVGTAYQEYQVLDSSELLMIPAATAEYLALNPTGVSAQLALKKLAELKSEETVLVSAAAGGLGHIMVQLCKMRGCNVVAICGGSKKKAFLSQLGVCDRIIDYKSEAVTKILDAEYKDSIDVAIDSVGRGMFDVFLRNLAPLGRLLIIGLAAELSDAEFEIKTQARVYKEMYWKGASVRCFMNHLYRKDHPRTRDELFEMYQSGKLQVKADETTFYGIAAIRDASKYLLSGKSCGKVVVQL